jgi:hypothetical protein
MNILMLIKEAPEQTENKTPQKIVDSQIAKRGGRSTAFGRKR